MGYVSIKKFDQGMSRAANIDALDPGSCWEIRNGHVNRNGRIERMKRWAPTYTLPDGCHGLFAMKRILFTFGSGPRPASLPFDFGYQQLPGPADQAMTRLISAQSYAGRIYAVAEYENGQIFHWYDGQRVAEWDTIETTTEIRSVADTIAATLRREFGLDCRSVGGFITCTGRPGVPFTLTASIWGGGDPGEPFPPDHPGPVPPLPWVVQPPTFPPDHPGPVPSLPWAAAQPPPFGDVIPQTTDLDLTLYVGTVQSASPAASARAARTVLTLATNGTPQPGSAIVSIKAGALELLSAPVAWAGSLRATALRIATAINAVSHVTADVVGDGQIALTGRSAAGASANGTPIVVTAAGALTAAAPNMAGGVTEAAAKPQVTHISIGGIVGPAAEYRITVDGRLARIKAGSAVMGTQLAVHGSKVYTIAGPVVRFSAINNALVWSPAPDSDPSAPKGAGALNVATSADGAEILYGIAPFQGMLAFFTESVVQVYDMVADPAANRLVHTIRNARTVAPALTTIGNIDTFFLTEGGVRSVRARQSTDAPVVQEVGQAIDPFIVDHMRAVGGAAVAKAASTIDPVDGRYLLAIADKIFVFSYFPFGKISAWSYYAPGFTVDTFCIAGQRLYALAGRTVYLYGGENGDEWPAAGETPTLVRLPFTGGARASVDKPTIAVDALLRGAWRARVFIDPNNEAAVTRPVVLRGSTYPGPAIRLEGTTTHVSVELLTDFAGPAEINEVTIGFGE